MLASRRFGLLRDAFDSPSGAGDAPGYAGDVITPPCGALRLSIRPWKFQTCPPRPLWYHTTWSAVRFFSLFDPAPNISTTILGSADQPNCSPLALPMTNLDDLFFLTHASENPRARTLCHFRHHRSPLTAPKRHLAAIFSPAAYTTPSSTTPRNKQRAMNPLCTDFYRTCPTPTLASVRPPTTHDIP
jgi:hypothetical protein